MRVRVVSALVVLLLCLSSVPMLLPQTATPTSAMEPMTATWTLDSASAIYTRPIAIQTGDEIVQFGRSNLVVGTNPTGNMGMVQQIQCTLSGDLPGTVSADMQWVDLWWSELGAGSGKGYVIGKSVLTADEGGTASAILVVDLDIVSPSMGVSTTSFNGYGLCLPGTGVLSGQVMIGTVTGTSRTENGVLVSHTGTMSFRRYSSAEVSGPVPMSGTGTGTGGYPPFRSLGSSNPLAPNDEFLQFTRTNITMPLNADASYIPEEADTTVTVSGGFSGTAHTAGSGTVILTAAVPQDQGWMVSVGTIEGVSGSIRFISLHDGLGGTGVPTTYSNHGYMFALMEDSTGTYAGKDYYGVIDTASMPSTGEVSVSCDIYTMTPAGGIPTAEPPTTEWSLLPGFGMTALVRQAADGGYSCLVEGFTQSTLECQGQLLKLSSGGGPAQQPWPTLLPTGLCWSSFDQTSDGGFVVAGSTSSASNQDACLIRATSTGDVSWTQPLGVQQPGSAEDVHQTSDGGFITVGSEAGFTAAFLVKTNADGYISWSIPLTTPSGERPATAASVEETADGGYVVTGLLYTPGSYNTTYLTKVDSAGNRVWYNMYPGAAVTRVHQTADGGYAFVGNIIMGPQEESYARLLKTDPDGTMVWDSYFGGNGPRDNCYDFAQTADGGYVMTASLGTGTADSASLIRTDSTGTELWRKTYGQDYFFYESSVSQTNDGGYVVGGGLASGGAFITKLAPDVPYSVPPTVTTASATNVFATSAMIHGYLNSMGSASSVTVSFEGATDDYYVNNGNTYQAETYPTVTMTSPGSFSYSTTGLLPNATYHFRAKAVGDGTAYGADMAFTTAGVGSDGDGVPPGVEDAAPNSGDGNNDGVLDSLQPNVSSFPNAATGGYVTLESPSGTSLENVAPVGEGSLPNQGKPSMQFPYGFFEFDIPVANPGDTVTLTVTLPGRLPTDSQYWKWNSTMGWYRIDFGSNDGDNIITITLQDGATGDDDFAINGVINDQGGPGWPFFGGGVPRGAPAFPSIYIGIGAAISAGILAYFVRRRLAHS